MNAAVSVASAARAVTIPCAVCGDDVRTLAAFADRSRAHLVKCSEHAAPQPAEEGPTVAEIWRKRLGANRDCDLNCEDKTVERVVRDRLNSWCNDRTAHGVVVAGPTGVGKTWLAYGALTALVDTGEVHPNEIVHGAEQDLLVPIADAWPTERAQQRASLLMHRRVLLLDDVGQAQYGRGDESRRSVLLDVLNRAVRRRMLVILTSNATSEDDLERTVGPAVMSRLWRLAGNGILCPGRTDRRTNHRYG